MYCKHYLKQTPYLKEKINYIEMLSVILLYRIPTLHQKQQPYCMIRLV